MRSIDQVKEFIESSFSPLDCVAEVHAYDKKIRFRVFGPNGKPLLRFEPVPLVQLRSGPGIKTIVGAVRRRLEQRGHKLVPAVTQVPGSSDAWAA